MATEEPGSRTGHGRTRGAAAGVFVVVTAVAGVFAFPANALAAPTNVASIKAVAAPVYSGATSPRQRNAVSGSGEPGDLNVSMLAMVASLGLAIAVPVAGRAHIARWRSIQQFRAELRNVDTIGDNLDDIDHR